MTATFVLVHGAHTGGWWWSDVRSRPRTAGHEVFTPSFRAVHRWRELSAGTT